MKIIRTLSARRAVALVAPATVLAIAVAVAPSFAGSFLTRDQARKIFVPRHEASTLFLTHKRAEKRYLSQTHAHHVYLQKAHAPVAATAASTAVFGPTQSTTPVDIPASGVEFNMPATGLVSITFSGTSRCTAGTDGVPCPIGILVDGLLASTGQVNFDASNGAVPTARSVTQTAVVTPGPHTVSVQYSGSSDNSVNFKLTSWNLVVEGFPGQ